MNAERFQTLAEAYGGAIARWPADVQDAAFAFLADQPDEADALLAEARETDALLDAAARLSPSPALRDRVLAVAPRERAARGRVWRWLTGAGVGAGLAAATAAGLVAGVNLSMASAPQTEDEALLAAIYDNGLADEPTGDIS